MCRLPAILTALLLALPAAADEGGSFALGADRFAAGDSVTHSEAGADNLFLAGETVRQAAPIAGSGHLAGRRVGIDAEVGGSLYAAGMDVSVTAPVAGDATLAGYSITVTAPVQGNLRAFASRVQIDAPVAGTALIGAESVTLNAPVAGDVALTAERLAFGPEARIDGTLRLYGDDPEELVVPAGVIAPERVTRHSIDDWRRMERPGPSLWGVVGAYLGGVLLVAAVAALIAAVAPGPLAEMRRRILARPFGTLGWGFLTLSAVIGAGIVLALTLVGIFLLPAAMLLAVAGGFLGYVVGAYSFGAGLLIAFGGGEPETLGRRALAALIGAGLAGLLALIPLAGWLFVLALVLAGVGAITLRVFRPAFFAA
jgi:hypothetical protein